MSRANGASAGSGLLAVAVATGGATVLLSESFSRQSAFLSAPSVSGPTERAQQRQHLRGDAATEQYAFEQSSGMSAAAKGAAATLVLGAMGASAMRRAGGGTVSSRTAVVRCAGDKLKLGDIKVGDKFSGSVVRLAPAGVWVDINAEKPGLIEKSMLPAGKLLKVGDKLEDLEVTEVQSGATPRERKIRLKPSGELAAAGGSAAVGDMLQGEVNNVADFGVFFNVPGFPRAVLCRNRFLEKNPKEYAKGEACTLKITEVQGDKVTVTCLAPKAPAGGGAAPKKTAEMPILMSKRIGDVMSGTVTKILEAGIMFVDIGAEADAAISANQLPKPIGEYSIGEKLTGLRVRSVNIEKKQVQMTPRTVFTEVRVGDQLKATVKDVSSFGVFFDAGLADDVLAPTQYLSKDMEYRKGEECNVYVLKVDMQKRQVAVSTTQPKQSRVGDEVKGKVINAAPGIGIFFDIGDNASALLRTKRLPKGKKLEDFQVGEEVEGLIVIKADATSDEIEVASKDGGPIDQGKPIKDYTPGQVVEGTVSRVVNFGIFVDIGAERDAVWLSSQLPKGFQKDFTLGQKLSGLNIIEADPSLNRLSVSDKRAAASYEENEEVSAVVMQKQPYGLFCDIGASTQALAPARFLEKSPEDYNVGDTVKMKIDTIVGSTNKITIKQLDKPKERDSEDGLEYVTLEDLRVGEKINGIVRGAKEYGVFVNIGLDRRDALMPSNFLGDASPDDFKAGDKIEVYVSRVDIGAKRVTLSMTEPPKRKEAGGVSMPSDTYIPYMDSLPNAEHWILMNDDDSLLVWEEPIPWKEWEEKYPGICVHSPECETAIFHDGDGFSGIREMRQPEVAYIPIPVHLRKADAEPPVVPEYDFADYPQGYDYTGIKPEIHTKYRSPPLNNPNWVWDHRPGGEERGGQPVLPNGKEYKGY
eukprot:TRINITY_DN8560_c0_g1_i7.p1 TRINITY_DN8560_c0_g1~~TRINITY_DN8560_c0_g1_i7.p1  ORF type:complete len:923 (-),score=315.32 TRINITY_DN8560_c0_g1_i7:169-2937(-)